MAVSLIALLLSTPLIPKTGQSKYSYILIYFFAISLGALHLISNYFTGTGLTESVIYHIQVGVGGAGFTEYLDLIVFSILYFVFFIIIFFYRDRLRLSFLNNRIKTLLLWPFLLIGLIYNPSFKFIFARVFKSTQVLNVSNIDDKADFLSAYVVMDKKTKSKKNILYLYLESFEQTYLNDDIFPGLAPNLKKIKKSAISFTNLIQAPGTGWTIAGMVASQCGIPLFSPSGGNNAGAIDGFLPRARCLGDVLSEQGYDLSFIGGANLNFAGKGNFYQTHRFDTILGKEELTQKLAVGNYQSSWGLYDDTTLEYVFESLEKKTNSKKPFGIFALTLDTHHPNGHPSRSCQNISYQDGKNPILNSVACTDHLVGQLMNDIIKRGLDKDLIIIISSDHLAMQNSASSLLEKGDRRNLFFIIDQELPVREINTKGSMIDVAATLSDVIGLGDQFGLGRSLLKTSFKKDRKTIAESISHWRQDIIKFWDFPLFEQLSVNGEESFWLNDRKIKSPFIVQIEKNGKTSVKLGLGREEMISEMRKAEAREEKHIAAARCELFSNRRKFKRDKETCLFFKSPGQLLQKAKLSKDFKASIKSENFGRPLKLNL